MFANAEIPHVIQIGAAQSLIGIAAILIGMGVAWGTLKTAVKSIGTDVQDVKKKVDKMRDGMSGHEADITGLKVHTKYGVSNSPTIPSKEGARVLKDSGFNTQYKKLKSKIFNTLDKRNPRTLYDYEVGAFEVLKELKDDPLMDPLKDYAVNHPQESLELIFEIASWVIRDDYAASKGTPVKHDDKNA